MIQGALFFNPSSERMDIRCGLESYYGGLLWGETMDVLLDGKWSPTRIELYDSWYLVGFDTDNFEILILRILFYLLVLIGT